MPLYTITPAVEAVSALGVEYRADSLNGTFALPAEPALHAALAAHGLQVSAVPVEAAAVGVAPAPRRGRPPKVPAAVAATDAVAE